jgi:hypothetical protein
MIGFVADAKGIDDGAGCRLWHADDPMYAERNVFVSDFEKHAMMNVDGRDRLLALGKSSEPKGEPKPGLRSMFLYRGDGVEVVVRYVVTKVCAPDDESCEVITYDANVTVKAQSGKRTIRTHGICGS